MSHYGFTLAVGPDSGKDPEIMRTPSAQVARNCINEASSKYFAVWTELKPEMKRDLATSQAMGFVVGLGVQVDPTYVRAIYFSIDEQLKGGL